MGFLGKYLERVFAEHQDHGFCVFEREDTCRLKNREELFPQAVVADVVEKDDSGSLSPMVIAVMIGGAVVVVIVLLMLLLCCCC